MSVPRLSRRPDTAKLQEALVRIIPEIPQIAVRGHSDKSFVSSHSHLISTVPIKGMLSREDLLPQNFLAKLYITVSSVFNHGASHAKALKDAQNIVMSFYLVSPTLGPVTDPSSMTSGFFRTILATPGLPVKEMTMTFPHYSLNTPMLDVPLAELRYKKLPYFSSMEDAKARGLDILFTVRRDAIVYRDTLKLLLYIFGDDKYKQTVRCML